MWMCISGWELLRANNWYVDLCILSVSLLLASHVAMSGKLVLIVIWSSCSVSAVYRRAVSSANSKNWGIGELLWISFMYMRKRSGPIIDPWGTPREIFWGDFDVVELYLMTWDRSERYEWKKSSSLCLMPYNFSFLRRMWGFTVSNA